MLFVIQSFFIPLMMNTLRRHYKQRCSDSTVQVQPDDGEDSCGSKDLNSSVHILLGSTDIK